MGAVGVISITAIARTLKIGPKQITLFSGDAVYKVEVPKGNPLSLKIQLPKQAPIYYSFSRDKDGGYEEEFANLPDAAFAKGKNKIQHKSVVAVKVPDQAGGSALLGKIIANGITNVKARRR